MADPSLSEYTYGDPPLESTARALEDPTLAEYRELAMYNFVARVGLDLGNGTKAAAFMAEFYDLTNQPSPTLEDLQADVSPIARLYTSAVQHHIEAAVNDLDADRSLQQTLWIICNEAYLRSLRIEAILETAGCDASELNELYDNALHEPSAVARYFNQRLRQRQPDNPESEVFTLGGVFFTRLQMVDEEIFTRDKLANPGASNGELGHRTRGIVARLLRLN